MALVSRAEAAAVRDTVTAGVAISATQTAQRQQEAGQAMGLATR